MLGNWKSWCRLCAKRNATDAAEEFKRESIDNQLEVINKHLLISLLRFDGSVSSICSDCLSFVEKLETFKFKCLQTQEMFQELIQKEYETNLDPESLRLKYGFDSEVTKYDVCHSQDSFDDPYSDSFVSVLDIKETVVVKQEVPVVKAAPIPRKRDRPGKPIETEDTNDDYANETDEHDPIQIRRSTRDIEKAKRLKEENMCEFCFEKFTLPCFLRDHISTKHCNQDRPFVCSKCEKRFPTKLRLRNHMTTHLPDELRLIHSCPHCDMKFSHKISLKKHITVSHKRKNTIWICEKCGKSCISGSALHSHKKTHIQEYNFHCSMCPRKFKSSELLKRHNESHNKHEGFICAVCGRKLKNKRSLRTHLLCHFDKTKYKCNYCGNEFKRSKTLQNHLLLHTGLRPYKCQFCDKTFTFGSSFRVHQKSLHPAELAALEASGIRKITKLPRIDELQPKIPVVKNSSSAK